MGHLLGAATSRWMDMGPWVLDERVLEPRILAAS